MDRNNVYNIKYDGKFKNAKEMTKFKKKHPDVVLKKVFLEEVKHCLTIDGVEVYYDTDHYSKRRFHILYFVTAVLFVLTFFFPGTLTVLSIEIEPKTVSGIIITTFLGGLSVVMANDLWKWSKRLFNKE